MPLVTMLRNRGSFRSGGTYAVGDADATFLVGAGYARSADDEAPPGNATRSAWAEHATRLGVAVADEDGRDDIRRAVEDATRPPSSGGTAAPSYGADEAPA